MRQLLSSIQQQSAPAAASASAIYSGVAIAIPGRRKRGHLAQIRATSAGRRMNSRAIPGAKKKKGHSAVF